MLKNRHFTIKTKDAHFIDFNLCNNVLTDCTKTSGLVVEKQTCRKFANKKKFDKTWKLISNIYKKLILFVN